MSLELTMYIRLRHLAASLAAALLLALPSAEAATILAETPEEMAAASDEVVLGTVVSVESRREEDGRVLTWVVLAPEQSYLSDAPPESVTIAVAGGTIGRYRTYVPGADSYEVGEHVLVFLNAVDDGTFVARALAYAKFTVTEGEDGLIAARAIDGLELVRHVEPPLVLPDLDRVVFPLVELELLIQRGIEARQ